MAESFLLREQLERIQRLTARMAAVQKDAAEVSEAMAHDREALRSSPLDEVRDYRPYAPEDETDEPRVSAPRESSRRRRRRRR